MRVFCADPEQDHALVRDVQLRAADLDPFPRRIRRLKLAHDPPMTCLVERLVELWDRRRELRA
jgi:hypothetical protein